MSAALDTRTLTWRELAARGAEISFAPNTAVTVRAPADVAPQLRAAITWRVESMRAQLRAASLLGGATPTAPAVPGLALPLARLCKWRGPVENYGRVVWVSREAQRPEPGLCSSCGEAYDGTAWCALCNAARVGALRAEGLLPATPTVFVPRVWPSVEAWRAELRAGMGRPDPLPPPTRHEPWTCEVCGAKNLSPRPEGCGRCELRAADDALAATRRTMVVR